MNVAERPLAAIPGRHRSTGDGVHLVANQYRKGVRLEPHLHREAQLVYAAKGRPAFNPLIVHVTSAEQAFSLGRFPKEAKALARKF